VFRLIVGDRIFILLLYVDDILALVDADEAKRLKEHLERKFGTVQFEISKKLSYLGMQLDIKEDGAVVDMTFYVEKLLEGLTVNTMTSPGNHNTFIVDDKAKLLKEEDRKFFHSSTAKLLYLSKRARPDILTVTIFLCTRVQCATEEDKEKLMRVLGYLKRTQSEVLILRASIKGNITAYVDAAFAIHQDSKSHTGVIVYVGKTIVYVSSKKQKCMSKSPTEAELIGLTDNLGMIELFQEFVEFVLGKKVEAPLVYQDCNAVVSLVTKGGGQTRTKHLRARMNLGKEMVHEGRVVIKYLKGEDMEADGFSKPYDPAEHDKFAKRLFGVLQTTGGR
jgi:hypothetical protein